ncbi:MAG: hypothetical protein M0017_06920 [Desulfobacteraceae bacterium]|nr:hypothetical protein [Desulfobacteraceae bacterium]
MITSEGAADGCEAAGQEQGLRAEDFRELNGRLAAAKQALTRKIERELGEIFLEVTRLHGDVRVRREAYQEIARLRAENAEMETRHLDDLETIRHLQAQLKACRSEKPLPYLRRVST